MGKMIRILSVFLALVLVMVIAGCDSEAQNSEDQITEEELIENVIAAAEDIETSQLDIQMELSLSGEAEGETFDFSCSLDVNGAVDTPNSESKIELDITDIVLDLPEEAGVPDDIPESIGMEMYSINNTVYMNIDIPGFPIGWIKTEAQTGDMGPQMQDLVKQLMPDLMEASGIEITGKEKVNGVECWKVTMTPDIDSLVDLIMQPELIQGIMGDIGEEAGTAEMMLGMGMMKGMIKEMLENSITNMSINQWYAIDTFFPVKSEIDVTIEINSEDLGSLIGGDIGEEFEIRIDMDMTMLGSGFNEPVTIELPPEAENATDLFDMLGIPEMLMQ